MDEVRIERDGPVAILTLNRPEKLNTISDAMLVALSEGLLACERDPAVRVIVITGAGRAFCAGLDLQDAASDEGIEKGGFAMGASLDLHGFAPVVLHNLDKPTLCALNGGAAGFGVDLALGCDIRIAARSAKLALTFTRRGVVPETGGTWLLPRLLGWGQAAELIFAGRSLGAEQAREIGLVSRVVEDAELMEAARALANEIAENAPLAVQAAKRTMRAGLGEGFEDHVQRAYLQVLPLLRSADFREGFTAFLQKRKPSFEGR